MYPAARSVANATRAAGCAIPLQSPRLGLFPRWCRQRRRSAATIRTISRMRNPAPIAAARTDSAAVKPGFNGMSATGEAAAVAPPPASSTAAAALVPCGDGGRACATLGVVEVGASGCRLPNWVGSFRFPLLASERGQLPSSSIPAALHLHNWLALSVCVTLGETDEAGASGCRLPCRVGSLRFPLLDTE
eukprot:gene7911-biopygen570